MRSRCCFYSHCSGWNEQHDAAIKDLRQNVQECMQKHLDAIQPKVVEVSTLWTA